MPQMQKDARVCWASFFSFQRGFFGVSFPNFMVYVNGGARGRVIARGNSFFYFVWIRARGPWVRVGKKYNKCFRFAQDAPKPYWRLRRSCQADIYFLCALILRPLIAMFLCGFFCLVLKIFSAVALA